MWKKNHTSCFHIIWTRSIDLVPITEYQYCQCELKWITMPENLANNSANLRPQKNTIPWSQLSGRFTNIREPGEIAKIRETHGFGYRYQVHCYNAQWVVGGHI